MEYLTECLFGFILENTLKAMMRNNRRCLLFGIILIKNTSRDILEEVK